MATCNASSGSLPLPKGKKYYCNFIYNYASRRQFVTDDTKLSLKFVEFLVGELKSWGYTQCYYYDEHSRPGSDVFDQIFEAADNSIWTFVIFTEQFSQNLWAKYSARAVMKTKIGENHDSRDKMIPIVLGNASVPKELDGSDAIWFDVDENNENTWINEEHKKQLKKLRRVLDEEVGRDESKFPIQDKGDEMLRSKEGHLIVNPQQSMEGASDNSQKKNERQKEALNPSVELMHVSNTQPLPPSLLPTSSTALEDCEMTSRTDKEDHVDKSVKTTENGQILTHPLTSSSQEDLSRSNKWDLSTDLESMCLTTDGLRGKHATASDGSDRNQEGMDGSSSQCSETDGSRQKNPEVTANQSGKLIHVGSWSTFL